MMKNIFLFSLILANWMYTGKAYAQQETKKIITIPCDSISAYIKSDIKDFDVFSIILDRIEYEKLSIYADENFKKKIPNEMVNHLIYMVDTVRVIDPESFKESKVVIKNRVDLLPADTGCLYKLILLASPIITSHSKTKVLGFAPVWQTLDEYGNKEEKTLFWVALP
jgi:hypothetical protein